MAEDQAASDSQQESQTENLLDQARKRTAALQQTQQSQPAQKPAPSAPPSSGGKGGGAGSTIGKIANVAMKALPFIMAMHDGGTVPKTGKYLLKEGETVVPAGRTSEYRKVYLSRKKKS